MSDTEALLKERQSTHGEYREHARCTQAIMRAVMTERNWERLSDIQRESLHMFAHKMGRISVGNPDEPDHWKDIAGYAVLVEQRLVPLKPSPLQVQTTEAMKKIVAELPQNEADPFNYTLEPPAIIMPKYYENGANGMVPGDRVQYTIDGRVGIAGEFMQDGDATVLFGGKDGNMEVVKWGHLRKVEPPRREPKYEMPVYDSKHELNGGWASRVREVNLAPWCVKFTYEIAEVPQDLFEKFWKRRAPDLFVLEPYVTSASIPRVLQGCYTLILGTNDWLLTIMKCPPEAREYFPNLYREKNQMEWEQLPGWQSALYSWHEDANKWELSHESWHVESE